jgi:Flp pilus assembly protein TadG
MQSDRRPRLVRYGDRGTVTAELAACLPVLVLVLAVALTAISAVASQVRLQDAAREAARAAARGDPATARRLAAQAAPGCRLTLTTAGGQVVAVAHGAVHPLAGFLPGMPISERATAALEPRSGEP